jgi:hypothetical protein
MSRVQFRKDTEGLLEFHPSQGRADSSASLTIYEGQSEWSGGTWPATITLGTYSQSLTATASAGDQSFSIATSGLVRGQRYWLTNHRNQVQEVTIDGFDGSAAYLAETLQYDQTTASTLEDHRLTYTLSTSATATRRRNLRAVWSYDVDTVSYQGNQVFDIVWQPFDIQITSHDLEVFAPWLARQMDATQLESYIEGGHRLLEMELRGQQIEPDLVRNPDDLRDALAYLVLRNIAESQATLGPDGEPRFARDYHRHYRQALTAFYDSKAWYDEDDTLTPPTETPRGFVSYGGTLVPSSSNLDDYGLYPEDGPPPGYAKVG